MSDSLFFGDQAPQRKDVETQPEYDRARIRLVDLSLEDPNYLREVLGKSPLGPENAEIILGYFEEIGLLLKVLTYENDDGEAIPIVYGYNVTYRSNRTHPQLSGPLLNIFLSPCAGDDLGKGQGLGALAAQEIILQELEIQGRLQGSMVQNVFEQPEPWPSFLIRYVRRLMTIPTGMLIHDPKVILTRTHDEARKYIEAHDLLMRTYGLNDVTSQPALIEIFKSGVIWLADQGKRLLLSSFSTLMAKHIRHTVVSDAELMKQLKVVFSEDVKG